LDRTVVRISSAKSFLIDLNLLAIFPLSNTLAKTIQRRSTNYTNLAWQIEGSWKIGVGDYGKLGWGIIESWVVGDYTKFSW